MEIAETPRLRIRELTLGDAPFVLELLNDPTFLLGIGDRSVRDLDAARAFLHDGPWTRQERAGHGQFRVALRATDEPIGICGLLYRPYLGLTDVGFALLQRFHGHGYALEAARAVVEYGRAKLGLERIVGLVSDDNRPSVRVLERLGLRFERRVRSAPDGPERALYS